MGLRTYNKKRNFASTPEPRGRVKSQKQPQLQFVIQKHDASRLHYDLRLEWRGTMKSWAVPKGPSLDPDKKCLAIQVEDHPIEYNRFEGTIPEGNYGAGTVMIWDKGEWIPSEDPQKGLARGKLVFELRGEKLSGEWSLLKMKPRGREKQPQWLLMKHRDASARAEKKFDVREKMPLSVVSRRSMEEIENNTGAAESIVLPAGAVRVRHLPKIFKPQLATLVDAVPAGENWIHEVKYDGYRILALCGEKRVRLITRAGNDWTSKLPLLRDAVEALKLENTMLDGELVALNEEGLSDFQSLQQAFKANHEQNLYYYVFDLPYWNGHSLIKVPLIERKKCLKRLLAGANSELIRYGDHIEGDGAAVIEEACTRGLEGIISKERDAVYTSRRSRSWLKIKCTARQEFVIGGFTLPSGSRVGLGALLLGYYDEKSALRYCGKVGTGFNQKSLKSLHAELLPLVQDTPPFARSPLLIKERKVRWIKPEKVCEVSFQQWTKDGALRHASFEGMRRDKPPQEVTREKSASTSQVVQEVKESKKEKKAHSRVTLTHPEKVLFPKMRLTKRDLYHYYESIAEHMLPWVKNRPLTLLRCPEGSGKECFFQKHHSKGLPRALRSVKIEGEDYIYLSEAEGLLALVQMGVLEIHTWNTSVDALEYADQLVLDLDPDPAVSWRKVMTLAYKVKEIVELLGLTSFPKVTGGKGVHIVVPLKGKVSWEVSKNFSRGVANFLQEMNPELYVATSSKKKRKDKIYIDYLRNTKGASCIAPYSLRAKDTAPIAVPLLWDDLPKIKSASQYTFSNIAKRTAQIKTDLWKEFEKNRETISEAMVEKLTSLISH